MTMKTSFHDTGEQLGPNSVMKWSGLRYIQEVLCENLGTKTG